MPTDKAIVQGAYPVYAVATSDWPVLLKMPVVQRNLTFLRWAALLSFKNQPMLLELASARRTFSNMRLPSGPASIIPPSRRELPY